MLIHDEQAWPRPQKRGEWSEAALRVLRERYLWRRPSGEVETPEDLFWRVAVTLAGVERQWGLSDAALREVAEAFHGLMVSRAFLPNSPTLMNAGKDNGLQYSACYVLPVEDTMEGIFDAVKKAAIIHKSGGGTGFAFSRLRAKDAAVESTGGKASGPVSFLRVFNAATEAVKQGGTRRGANMGILRVDHPDIEEFITCKLDGGIANFNISVAVSDAFMQAVRDDGTYDLVDHKATVVGTRSAREVFDKMVAAAWASGDPGLIFIDRVNRSRANPTPDLGRIEACNPCGEQNLLPNDACNLGSINLAAFAAGDEVDWPRLEQAVGLAVRMLDDVIEANPYPLPEIDDTVHANRRIGLGVMGWADLLLKLRIPYASEEALALADQIMAFISRAGHEASARLAKERGGFPNFARSIYRDGPPLRNAAVTTVAPTGTISLIAGCSSGIEPLFALAFQHVVDERRLEVASPAVEQVLREAGMFSDALMAHVAEQGTVGARADVPERLRAVLATAHEIAPQWHVRMQAAFQKHCDNGVSKTINLPASATRDDVGRAYRLADELGCMGITVFREGSKGQQVLYAGAGTARVEPRPRRVRGATYRVESPVGTVFVTVNDNAKGEPFEVFCNVGKAGSDIAAVSEALGRLLSLTLRMPSPIPARARVEEIVRQLIGIGGARHAGFGPRRVRSLPDAIAQALAEHIGMEDEAPAIPDVTGDLCPDCGHATLVFEEGCQKCHACGYSMC
ncbi:MAG: vitamin B12-dependent ribonucleotide reductase [Armatimonadetes bacterium]|nr:vitamin B12-dependent ribonucleotide reductase [Armatimonadota bacterium]